MGAKKSRLYFWLLFFLTPLRMVVVPFMPLASRLCYIKFHAVVPHYIYPLLLILYLVTLIGCISGTDTWINGLVGLWIWSPLFMIQFCRVKLGISEEIFKRCFLCFRNLLCLINIGGAIAYFFIFHGGDAYGEAYGNHFQAGSGLAMVDAIMIFYYTIYILEAKEKAPKSFYYWLAFFAFSFIFCFYGLGLVCMVLAFAVYFSTRIDFKRILYGILGVILAALLFVNSDSSIVEYNQKNIDNTINAFKNPEVYAWDARKVLLFTRYADMIQDNPALLFSGTGVGGFNSRVAFMLNQDSDNAFTRLLGHHEPIFHEKYIYPLWNKHFVSQEEFTDGTRNKPFSSMIGILSEGGLFVFLLYIYFWLRFIKAYYKKGNSNYIYSFLFIFNVFWIISMFSEVWFESSEFLLFVIVNFTCIAYCNGQTLKRA